MPSEATESMRSANPNQPARLSGKKLRSRSREGEMGAYRSLLNLTVSYN